MKEIIFTNTLHSENNFHLPKPAVFCLPEWYKKTPSYLRESRNFDSETIKKCVPVFDALTSGYIIFSYCDIHIETDKNGNKIVTTGVGDAISRHDNEQFSLHPNSKKQQDALKFINVWSIKTPKNYSCLVINPFHRSNIFSILEGIVDTDRYHLPINLPFLLNDFTFTGLIPAGTPIAQIIPFKRDSWKMQFGTKEDENKIKFENTRLHSLLKNKYKTLHHEKKDYK